MAININHQTNDISSSSGSMTMDGSIPGGTARHSSAPSSPTTGDIYYDTTDNMLRVYSTTGWKGLYNNPPVPTSGTATSTIANDLGSAFTLDITQYFTDTEQASSALSYSVSGTLPPGLAQSGTNLVHDNITFAGSSATAYSFTATATDSNGAVSSPKSFSITLAENPPPNINYIPSNFNSPDQNITSSQTISTSGIGVSTLCWVYLVGGGGGGQANTYQNNGTWFFQAEGGSARLILCTAGDLHNSTCTVGAGRGVQSAWRPADGTTTSITIGGTTYGTNHGSANQLVIHPTTGGYISSALGNLNNDGFTISATSTSTNSITHAILQSEDFWGNGRDNGGLRADTPTQNRQRVYCGGNGLGRGTGGTNYRDFSTYAGDGAGSYNANGSTPGGGASYQATGGAGSVRIYYN